MRLTVIAITILLNLNFQVIIGQNRHTQHTANTLLVFEENSIIPLPYVNISVTGTHDGIISNEQGRFMPDELNAKPTDTICFQHIGYERLYISYKDLLNSPIVYLKNNTFNINEITVFPDNFNPQTIVEKVLENRDKNYKIASSKSKVFIRQRSITDFKDFNIDPKKKSALPIKESAKHLNQLMNRKFVSYTDFIGNYYQTDNSNDTLKTKLESIEALKLNPEMTAFKIVSDSINNSSFHDIDSGEYWKIKSGFLSVNIVNSRNTIPEDTLTEAINTDSIGREPLVLLLRNIDFNLSFTKFTDKDIWDFLYKPDRYTFTLDSGTIINGEYVYIINFTPGKKGLYKGCMYVSADTYALLRADYEYATGKTGKSIQLLGIGYTENMFKASVYFEKHGDSYRVKQFSKQSDIKVNVDRPLAFIKKKNRKLFDKKLEEIKTNLQMEFTENDAFEYFVIDEESISKAAFTKFKQAVYHDVNYTDSLNASSWSNFSKIVPVDL